MALNQQPELLLQRFRWPDGTLSLDPDDYEIIHDGKAVGRFYRSESGGRACWQWSVYGATASQRSNGIAASPSDGKAAFMSAWEANHAH